MKQIVLAQSPSGSPPFVHLLPIVEVLAERSGHAPDACFFYQDKDGWRCDLPFIIDFDYLVSRLEIPKSICLMREKAAILCTNSWIEIKGLRLIRIDK